MGRKILDLDFKCSKCWTPVMQELSSAHETLSEALETAFEQWSALQES